MVRANQIYVKNAEGLPVLYKGARRHDFTAFLQDESLRNYVNALLIEAADNHGLLIAELFGHLTPQRENSAHPRTHNRVANARRWLYQQLREHVQYADYYNTGYESPTMQGARKSRVYRIYAKSDTIYQQWGLPKRLLGTVTWRPLGVRMIAEMLNVHPSAVSKALGQGSLN